MTTVIVITARRNGFRRCGVGHSDQPITWQPGDFTSEQWHALVKEPQLIVTCVEVDLEPEWEPRHALTSSTALPEASNTAQNVQSQTLEANTATLGDGVLLSVAPGAGNVGLDALWEDALMEDRAYELANAIEAPDGELDSLWEDALKEDQEREAAKTLAEKPPANPRRAKAGK